MEYNVKLISHFKKDEILRIKNTNNNKYLHLKILNVNFDFSPEKNGIISTYDFCKFTMIQGTDTVLTYKTYYTCITLDCSYYNTENLELIEKGRIFYMDEEFLKNSNEV